MSRYSKSWTQALQEVQEQTGVRKVDFVDGITPDIQEEKCPDCGKEVCECKEEEVKEYVKNPFEYEASDSKGMRFVVKKRTKPGDKFSMMVIDKNSKMVKDWGSHPSLDGAKKFGKKRGFTKVLDGMQSASEEIVGEENNLHELKSAYEKEIAKFLSKGSKIKKGHKPDKKNIDKVIKDFKKKYQHSLDVFDAQDKKDFEDFLKNRKFNDDPGTQYGDVESPWPDLNKKWSGKGKWNKDSKWNKLRKEEMELEEHCGECGAMDHIDEKFKKGKYTVRDGNTDKVIGTYDSGEKAAKAMHKLLDSGKYTDLEVKMEEFEIDEKKGSDYELYHKDFSSAMQHAYAHAKKKGFTVDPEEIDNKVATGPRKPSAGKTNRYILGTDKKQKVHIQVANLDNKKFELNMYIEETEKENMDIKETIKQVIEGKVKKEDSDKSEPGTQGDDKEYAKKRDAVLKKYGVKACAECETEEEKKACFKDLDDAHVADHEEQVQKESENEKKDTSYGVKKKAKEPQNETLLDKVRTMMKEKKKKSSY